MEEVGGQGVLASGMLLPLALEGQVMTKVGFGGRGLKSVHIPPVGRDDSCMGCWFSVSARPYRGRELRNPAQASSAAP